MKKLIVGLMPLLMVSSLYADKGKLRVTSDPSGAYVYVDGKKKAMTGEGFTSILLEEGEYTIKVAKLIDEKYEYVSSRKVFVGEETSTKLSFKLKKQLSAKGKALQAKADVHKLVRWQRSGKIVTDTKLGLMWQDDSPAKSAKKSWKSAKRYCHNLSLGGYSDWRLPSYDELLTIVDYDRHKPAIMPSFKHVVNTSYYSSSQYVAIEEGYSWYVDFTNGGTKHNSENYEIYVRCVRSRQ